MRRFGPLGLAVALCAVPGIAAAAPSAAPCTPAYAELPMGQQISVSCAEGPAPTFRIIAHCADGSSTWPTLGSTARRGAESSTAACRARKHYPAKVDSYDVEWISPR